MAQLSFRIRVEGLDQVRVRVGIRIRVRDGSRETLRPSIASLALILNVVTVTNYTSTSYDNKS